MLSNALLAPLSPYPCQTVPGKGQVRHSQIPRFQMIKTLRGRGQALGGSLFCPFVPATCPISKDFQQHQEPDTWPILFSQTSPTKDKAKLAQTTRRAIKGDRETRKRPRIWPAQDLQLLEQLHVNEMGRRPPFSSPWPVVMETGI